MSDTPIHEYYPENKPNEAPPALTAGEAIAPPSDPPTTPLSDATPEEWKEAFQSEWWTLEQVYAVALDRGQDPMSGEGGAMVREATARLRDLLADGAAGPGDRSAE